ncbi:tail fiber assembly protein [Serratia marcescens]|uniref:tail fiber assembly protein n=1 Tax=Serratia marcescens TaxID=615 RepID=UPI000926D602|nr:tail fiber assembly protein [Serratia marcescens]OJH83041.1 phage tail fiber assembly protein [Serratia marcescens]
MKNYQNFTLGKPKTPEQAELQNRHNVKFLFADDGTEWYCCQKGFARDTIKFSYDSKGVICSIAINKDVSTLWPDGLSVAEVADTSANRRADILGGWVFDGKAIVKRTYTPEELQAQAEVERSRRLTAAAKILGPLQDAEDLAIATEEEKAALLTWKKYRVLLNRIDTGKAPDIDWPPVPE